MPPKTATKPESFEQVMSELERIVAAMESGDLPLEQALQNYQRGVALLKQCRDTLESAEQRIHILENGMLSSSNDISAPGKE